jgi:hypothetical protein
MRSMKVVEEKEAEVGRGIIDQVDMIEDQEEIPESVLITNRVVLITAEDDLPPLHQMIHIEKEKRETAIMITTVSAKKTSLLRTKKRNLRLKKKQSRSVK